MQSIFASGISTLGSSEFPSPKNSWKAASHRSQLRWKKKTRVGASAPNSSSPTDGIVSSCWGRTHQSSSSLAGLARAANGQPEEAEQTQRARAWGRSRGVCSE